MNANTTVNSIKILNYVITLNATGLKVDGSVRSTMLLQHNWSVEKKTRLQTNRSVFKTNKSRLRVSLANGYLDYNYLGN